MDSTRWRGGMAARAAACALAAWACADTASSHALRHELQVGEAIVVALRFTDGEPFAFERYELFRGEGKEPVQTGLTDGAGRLVLLPGTGAAAMGWRLRAYAADGHGIETALAIPQHDGVPPAAAEPPAPALPDWGRVVAGVCLILGLGLLGRRLLRRPPR
ncbi:ABC transporter permease [Pseudorhodoferax aquiterrae]|nr:ABC transporter permease [Pseudorhodoferax aquiterrae]